MDKVFEDGIYAVEQFDHGSDRWLLVSKAHSRDAAQRICEHHGESDTYTYKRVRIRNRLKDEVECDNVIICRAALDGDIYKLMASPNGQMLRVCFEWHLVH